MLAGRLVRLLSEPADQLLEHRAHHVVRHRLGVEVDLGEPRDDLEEQIRLVELRDVLLELEALEDVLRVGGEAADERPQVGSEVVRIALQRLERELRRVVERHAGDAIENGLQVLHRPALQRLVLLQHLLPRVVQHAVEPPEDREREDHLPVVGLLVVAAEEVGHRPDEGGDLGEGLELAGGGGGHRSGTQRLA